MLRNKLYSNELDKLCQVEGNSPSLLDSQLVYSVDNETFSVDG